MLNILIDIRNFYYILLDQCLQKDSPNICEIFLDVKMVNGMSGKYKTRNTK